MVEIISIVVVVTAIILWFILRGAAENEKKPCKRSKEEK